jgi:hypothetical protein
MSQLVFISDDGKALRLPFRPGRWTAERIKTVLEKSGVKGDHIVALGSTDEEHAEMKALTDVLAPAGKDREVAPMVDGADEPFLRDLQQRGARLTKWCHLLSAVPISLEEDIRLRAYSLYVQRGRRNGFALDDWLEAEAEILKMLRQRAEP